LGFQGVVNGVFDTYYGVFNENGDTLAIASAPTGSNEINLTTPPDAPAKLILKAQVYTLPGMIPEHQYSDQFVKRIKFTTAGYKYVGYGWNSNIIHVYNLDHTLWKTIIVPDATQVDLHNIDDTLIDDDPELEYIVDSRLIAEDGTVLIGLDFGSMVSVNRADGLPPKLTTASSSGGTIQFSVYGLPGLNLEHTYDRAMTRKKHTTAGEKYYYADSQFATLHIFNADHTPWKTVVLQTPPQYLFGAVTLVDDNIIANDPKVEAAYFFYENGGGYYETRIVNEDGANYLTLPNAVYFRSLPLEGHDQKFCVLNEDAVYSTDIYSVNNALGTPDAQRTQQKLYPNPVNDRLYITEEVNVTAASLFDANGRLVFSEHGPITSLSVKNLDCGSISSS